MADVKSDKKSAEQRKQQQAEDGRKAMLDYEAEAAAVRARTEKLRALRLAREAALPPVAKTRGRKSTGAATKTASKPASKTVGKRARTKAQPLSQWLNDQRKDGRRD